MIEVTPKDEHNKDLIERVHPIDWVSEPDPSGYDFVAIGGGTAAQISTAGAALSGLKVALIERQYIGGDCLMVGCVPSKSLIHAAKMAHRMRTASELGIEAKEVQVNFSKVMETLRESRSEISLDDSAVNVSARGIDVLYGHARFTGTNTIDLNGKEIRFKRAIVCTGTRPILPNIPGLVESDPLTNESVFNLTELPKRLAVIGAGAIGCELGQALNRLGARVTMLVRDKRLLAKEDPRASDYILNAFQKEGVEVLFEATLVSVEKAKDGLLLKVQKGDFSQELVVDRILVATGRSPNVENLGLEEAGVKFDHKGIQIDDYQRTTNKRVYAAGDVANELKFTHSAYAYGEYAAMNALLPFRLFKSSKRVIPWCTYVDPEVAHVGWSYKKLMENESAWECYEKSFSDNDRAQVERSTDGFAKLYGLKSNGKLIAATVVGESAGDLIGEMSLAITTGRKLSDIGSTIHSYPTRSDIYRLAIENYKSKQVTPILKSFFKFWFKLIH
ncbi:FAD-dependent oxidoreductase [Puniceicoccaceae bacterium K14]|nr:FAD-dependent oxidoreductase [Puniceicoccaceae bacterium K14]